MTRAQSSERPRVERVRRFLLAGAWLVLAVAATVGQPPAQESTAPTVLITGSNRGIGLEFTRQYAADGWRVIATARSPEKATELRALAERYPAITVEKLDVTDLANIDALAKKYRGVPIDILLNNAGITGGSQTQIFGELDYDVFYDVMHTNVEGPLKMAEAFIENVAASEQKKIVNITSSEGSIGAGFGARVYFYRASKAALNMVMVNLARNVAARGVIVGLVNPGVVDTDMMAGAPIPKQSPEESVTAVRKIIDGLTPEMSGTFRHYTGEELPW